MARTAITAVHILLSGVVPSAVDGVAGDVANGNVIAGNDGERMFVDVKNTSADTAYTATFVTPGTVGQAAYAIADKVESIAFGVKKRFGPFPLAEFTSSIRIDVQNAALKLEAFYI